MGDKFTFGSVWDSSWNFFRDNFKMLIIFGLVFSLLPSVVLGLIYPDLYVTDSGLTPGEAGSMFASAFPFMLLSGLLSLLMVVSILYFVSVKSKGKSKKLEFKDILKGGWSYFFRAIVLSIILTIFLALLFLLLIIPGIIFLVFWLLAIEALVIGDVKVMKTFGHSMSLIKGRWWKTLGYLLAVFLLGAVFIGISGAIFGVINSYLGYIIGEIANVLFTLFFIVFFAHYYLVLKKAGPKKK